MASRQTSTASGRKSVLDDSAFEGEIKVVKVAGPEWQGVDESEGDLVESFAFSLARLMLSSSRT